MRQLIRLSCRNICFDGKSTADTFCLHEYNSYLYNTLFLVHFHQPSSKRNGILAICGRLKTMLCISIPVRSQQGRMLSFLISSVGSHDGFHWLLTLVIVNWLRKHEIVFAFSIISEQWVGVGHWNSSSLWTKVSLPWNCNTLAADVQSTQWTRLSAVMIGTFHTCFI